MAASIKQIRDEIIDQYLNDENPRPWILGFSGGKDSTMLLQVTWKAIQELPSELRTRPIYVVCNNTMVENPMIIKFNESVLENIEKASMEQSMPIEVIRTNPRLQDSYWVKLIGRGYPAPNNSFRWCTDKLKINPTTLFIKEKISEVGEAIILLGTRKDESYTRKRSMEKHEIRGERLRRHVLPNASVFSPIENVLTKEVWSYLNQVQSPWGSDNKQLQALYRNANGGDCPVVIDDTTPSCGNSRFGCWVCTVVRRDKSMEALIDNGEEWMEPLMEFRDYLAEHRNDRDKRMYYRRNGLGGGKDDWGPYTIEERANLLEMLLSAQKEIREEGEEFQLINYQELVAIQVTWYRDHYFDFNVSEIYNKVFGTSLSNEDFQDHLIFEKEILKEKTKDTPGHFTLINELLELQKSKTILMNNYGLQRDLENRIGEFVKDQTI